MQTRNVERLRNSSAYLGGASVDFVRTQREGKSDDARKRFSSQLPFVRIARGQQHETPSAEIDVVVRKGRS